MALKSLRFIHRLILIMLCFAPFQPLDRALALSGQAGPGTLPRLDVFTRDLKNNQPGELRGVFVPDLLAAEVVQQPAGNNVFVSRRDDTVTQFRLAARFGATGLLAHNDLTGEHFSSLREGQEFYLVYGDGKTSAFVVTEILAYQALEPENVLSPFVSLESEAVLTASEVFSRVYMQPGMVVLQTCLARNGNPSWGRLFVIAEPSSPDS